MSDEIKGVGTPETESTARNEELCVTMVDVLEQEQKLEEECAAVLGGSDEKLCTYGRGYIKRQALYSCLTCCPEACNDASKRAGICLACCYQCHEHHELIELYTKRNFRCDCPTIRIPERKCTFAELGSSSGTKLEANIGNAYNQNFAGVYCTCKRPYPDPEDSVADEMIQCVICEDWYHTRHLSTSIPPHDSYSEMICDNCMDTYCCIRDYAGMAVNKVEPSNESHNVSVVNCTIDEEKLRADLDKSISDIMPNISSNDDFPDSETTSNETSMLENVQYGSDLPLSKKIKLDETSQACCRPTDCLGYKGGAVFWPENWRTFLCSCKPCCQLYENKKLSFLLDPEDTVQSYEESGLKNTRETDYERGIRALSSMGRIQQIEAITEYNRMKDKLKEYLRSFVTHQRVVTEDDINRFFEDMKNERDTTFGKPHFCR